MKKKKLLCFITSCIMAFALIGGNLAGFIGKTNLMTGTVNASIQINHDIIQYGQYGDFRYGKIDEDGDGIYDYIKIILWNGGLASSVTIPESIEGLPVTSLGKELFFGCLNLVDITIPDSVTTIESDVFTGTQWLNSRREKNPLVIVNNMLVDGINCSGKVVISNGIISIADNAFNDCNDITSITIPDSVTNIGDYAFISCDSLTNITIPDSVTNIGAEAFAGTPWLEAKRQENPLVIVNNVLVDGRTCSGNVVIPDVVTVISGSAFLNCTDLISITMPDSIIKTGGAVFVGCKCLREVKLSENLDSLSTRYLHDNSKYGFFKYCESLEIITIPESVTYIDADTFYDCTNLSNVTIENPECEIYHSKSTISNGYYYDNNDYYFNGVIYGHWFSTAHEYAAKYDCYFASIDGEPDYLTGDITGNYKIDLYDAIEICRYLMNMRTFTDEEKVIADYNFDGFVDLYDVIAVAKKLLEN